MSDLKLKFKNCWEWVQIKSTDIETMLWILKSLLLSCVVALVFIVYILFMKDKYNDIHIQEVKQQDFMKQEVILKLIDKITIGSDIDTNKTIDFYF